MKEFLLHKLNGLDMEINSFSILMLKLPEPKKMLSPVEDAILDLNGTTQEDLDDLLGAIFDLASQIANSRACW